MIKLFKHKNDNKQQIKTFNEMVDLGKKIIDSYNSHTSNRNDYKHYNDHPIIAYINLLGRKTQSEALLESFKTELHGYNPHSFTCSHYYEFMSYKLKDLDGQRTLSPYEIMNNTAETITVNLNRSLILPWPWSKDRLIDAINGCDPWKEDIYNHNVYVWSPIGICWVSGGNHSIASGVLKGQGQIKNATKIDMSPIYNYIYTDGVSYYDKLDNSILCEVRDLEFAAIFEIGRLMVNNNISFTGG